MRLNSVVRPVAALWPKPKAVDEPGENVRSLQPYPFNRPSKSVSLEKLAQPLNSGSGAEICLRKGEEMFKQPNRQASTWGSLLLTLAVFATTASPGFSQEPTVQYPLAVAAAPDGSSILVDLNLPGVWRVPAGGGKPELVVQGSKMFRKPLNRPRSAVVLEDGTILVTDTATREIYKLAADGSGEPQPLTDGYLGIPNSLALTSDGNLIIADLESHFVYKVPATGGQPELLSKTNARGVHVDANGRILAVLAPAGPPQLVEVVAEGDDKPIVNETAFQFPHNVVAASDGTLYVTDGYAKAVWKVVSGMPPEKLVEGEPLKNPVGLALNAEGKLLVADPHAKQLFEIDPSTAAIKPLLQ